LASFVFVSRRVRREKSLWHAFFTTPVKQVMEIKRNEATRNRPQGDRVLDAPYVYADLPAFIEQVKDEKSWKKNDRNGITVFKSDDITMVISALKEGAAINENTVNGHITLHVLNGRARISTPDGEVYASDNNLITFHPNIPHSIEATTDVVLLITTYGVKDEENHTQNSFLL
jgi:quercetin dioxygenase-like cupin family protein